VSTESIASPSQPTGDAYPCAACGAPMADDQRYCLECGERRAPLSSSLLASVPAGSAQQARGAHGPPATQRPAGSADGSRNNAVTVLAGVGVLLLAMGVGVLIGRSGASKQPASAPQVISVASTPSSTTASAPSEASFSDSWPSGTNGYTVQLQTLPQSTTKVSQVQAAKAAAAAKGAKSVGALRSEDFSSLKPGSYVIYSGVYHKRAEAEKALGGLKKSFPGAVVIKVSSGASAHESSAEPSEVPSTGSKVGESFTHPAPPSVVQNEHNTKGQGFEQKSKNLPNVISTG
jgi:hypothetical protein